MRRQRDTKRQPGLPHLLLALSVLTTSAYSNLGVLQGFEPPASATHSISLPLSHISCAANRCYLDLEESGNDHHINSRALVNVYLKPPSRVQLIKSSFSPPGESIGNWSGPLRESSTQPRPPPPPNINLFVKAHLSAHQLGEQSLNLPSNTGHPSKQSPSSTTQLLPQTLSKMMTLQGTNRLTHTRQMREKQVAEFVLQHRL